MVKLGTREQSENFEGNTGTRTPPWETLIYKKTKQRMI